MDTAERVLAIAAHHGIATEQLAESKRLGDALLAEIVPMIAREFPPETLPGVEMLVIGSIAKRQCTRGSDIDFFGITEQPLEKERTEPIIRMVLEKAGAMGFELPFAHGPMGVFVPRSEIEQLHVVLDDTRKRFRRMTLIAASTSVYRPAMRAEMMRNVLDAFIGRERTPRIRGVLDYLMLNARLGNLVAEWQRTYPPPDGGYVNWAKCFTIYRVEYVSSLAAIIRAGIAAEGRSRTELVEALASGLDLQPLDRLAAWYDDVPDAGKRAIATMIGVSNETLCIYARDGVRAKLAAGGDDSDTLAICAELEQQMRRLEGAVVDLYYREGPFKPWIEQLGLFG